MIVQRKTERNVFFSFRFVGDLEKKTKEEEEEEEEKKKIFFAAQTAATVNSYFPALAPIPKLLGML